MLRVSLISIILVFGCGTSEEHAPYIGTDKNVSNIQNGISENLTKKVDAGVSPKDAAPKNSYIPPNNSEILEGPCSTTEPHVCYKFLGYLGGNAECFLGKQYCEDGGWSHCVDPNGFQAPDHGY